MSNLPLAKPRAREYTPDNMSKQDQLPSVRSNRITYWNNHE